MGLLYLLLCIKLVSFTLFTRVLTVVCALVKEVVSLESFRVLTLLVRLILCYDYIPIIL